MSCDRISELPDCLLTHILSYFENKDSVKTSVLSKRWEFLWLKVSALDLNTVNFLRYGGALVSFMDRFLEFNRGSCLQNFKIKCNPYCEISEMFYPFEEWTAEVVPCGVQHLDVENGVGPRGLNKMPKNVFVSKTLVSLKLVRVDIEGLEDPNFVVSLPCLKIMHLEEIYYKCDNRYYSMAYMSGDGLLITEKLISGSPVLEDITLGIHDYGQRKQVNSFSTNVPQCLLSTLEYVKINNRIMLGQTGIRLVNYFLENSAVLKKLTISCTYSHENNIQQAEHYKKLLTSAKLSPRCQICVSCCH